MNNLTIESVPILSAMEQLPDISQLYKKVFAAPPWNEAYRCTVCEKSFGQNTSPQTTCCNMPIVEYYPLEKIQKEIGDHLSLNRARLALALDTSSSSKLIGFAWGWQDTLACTNAQKFHLKPEEATFLAEVLGMTDDDAFFYLSELGLEESYRGNGMGKKLYDTVLGSRDISKSDAILMRTSRKSPAYSISTKSLSYPLKVIFEYRDELDRVILSS